MKQINIGGVPEHFNLAWHLTLNDGLYKKEGIDLCWHDFPGGTGAMCKALEENEIDIAVILTEGIIKAIIEGNPAKIVQTYVKTPLNWGIHVSNTSPYRTISDLKGTKAAISRNGSGSHLMSYINAKNYNWDLKKDLKFKVINDLDGAVTALTQGNADYFLWEKFMTKPLVDTGIFRRIGNCPSPWPCFVIAASNDIIENNAAYLKTILKVINSATSKFKEILNIDKTIAKHYGQQLEDVREWLNLTEWSQELIDETTVNRTQQQLFDLNIISEIVPYSTLVHEL
ncbi:substrate-binding domain-containing protein [Snuella sedimenti]|uniref:ABC transporter substrate-binding protein n=1 Tax=Snuella sedimenti TaxID=2798802 RepID=A0A8J7LPE0_9FLAO|nr:substrate-binding domain-containing protein [Snuella sedimenti]MBJ6369223.1 ABC transporter substrate-binding protein [Snuella sedimenti]